MSSIEKVFNVTEERWKYIAQVAMIQDAKAAVEWVFEQENLEIHGLIPSRVVVDITGGTVTMTLGMVFGAIDAAIPIQYIDQFDKARPVIPLDVTPEIVLDKVGRHLAGKSSPPLP